MSKCTKSDLSARHEGNEQQSCDSRLQLKIYCHREVNAITCFCDFYGKRHECEQVFKGTLVTEPCPDECRICEKVVEEREYYEYRFQKNLDGYTVCGVCNDKVEPDFVCEICFCTKFWEEKDSEWCVHCEGSEDEE